MGDRRQRHITHGRIVWPRAPRTAPVQPGRTPWIVARDRLAWSASRAASVSMSARISAVGAPRSRGQMCRVTSALRISWRVEAEDQAVGEHLEVLGVPAVPAEAHVLGVEDGDWPATE